MASEYQHFDDDEFVSALEDVEGEEDDDDCDNDSSMTEHGLIGKEHRGDDMDIDGGETDGGDLFSTAFVDQPDAPEDSDEDEPPAPIGPTFVATEHTQGCTSSRGPSTPPPEKSRSSSAQLAGPRPPNPYRDLSWNLRRLKRFYLRAKELIPRLPLAEHRYWIGVLSVKNKPDNFKDEKDFLWLKGNRMTTVETIWHMYQQSTATDDFVILLGHERVDFQDCVEELDVFGEKKVIFRAVLKTHPDARGREVSEAIIPKKVVPGAKKVQQEVILLDDDDEI